MPDNILKPYTFIDGDFSMEINVSEEEKTIYMSQKEISKFLNVNKGTISRNIKKIDFSKWDTVAENAKICIESATGATDYYNLEIIKEIGQKYNPERLEKLETWLYELLPESELEIIDSNYEIVRYNQDNLDVPVRLDKTTNSLWMTQKEMSNLFETTIQNVGQHISNVFEEKELEISSVVKKNFITASDGKHMKLLSITLT